jgi:hypothetical protein
MNILIWALQISLALAFLFLGIRKLTQPRTQLPHRREATGLDSFSMSRGRFIAIIEILVSLGLILPVLTGFLPVLTFLMAIGVIVLMLCAAVVNIRYGKLPILGLNILVLVIAAAINYSHIVAEDIPTLRFIKSTAYYIGQASAWQKYYDSLAPKAGDLAKDFELKGVNHENSVRLSHFKGKMPVALIFGSYT